ncbi:hypothetical protein [Sphingopyxis flava]|uniref:Uncharacterized protein n=1 Tax=Sphingopyxis flava TaxID=1507287 RepID=A0A1T4ZVL8_9SPHN|nr:hypothetical protein [Sphingopyxis flava]SKB26821.1 hypothetical protein SAMN06295937_1001237 [Sphingopyxis flava]
MRDRYSMRLGGQFAPPKRYDAQVVLDRIAEVATNLAAQAGVGAMETAGGLLGYLVENPRDLETFMVGGIWELPPGWFQRHNLTWHAQDGSIVHPADVRSLGEISQKKRGRR